MLCLSPIIVSPQVWARPNPIKLGVILLCFYKATATTYHDLGLMTHPTV